MDLTTSYLGLRLRNPLVASASPLSYTLDGIRRLAESGVGAVVMFSLFEEQIRERGMQVARIVDGPAESFPEALSYFPDAVDEDTGPRRYLHLLERAVARTEIPVIASLNGVTLKGWTGYARAMQDAGAAAIELNIYYLPEEMLTSARDAEQRFVDILAKVKAAVSVPVAVKLTPYFSSFGEMAVRLDRAGADGLVLFNRFMQTDINPDALTVSTGFKLSSPAEATVARSWIARLRGQVRASLAASTGVETSDDVAAYLLAGADVVMTTSALLRHGPAHAAVLLDGLTAWMRRKGFGGVADFRGMLATTAGAAGPGYGRSGYLSAVAQATRAYAPR